MVAPGLQRRARRRRQGGGVEVVVAKAALRQPLEGRRQDQPADGLVAPAEVVDQDRRSARR
jgi:hypothetical protein